ncbi:hypothetical protein BDN72DRAFT_862195 [Pluteus cervinus]|uniref:Uncharacterized protein n=1 Tax=Pluteus cervinus TaxID=181527 RepID=A0ACD3ABQ5_9AGAR|nr:hypothetical protein BDN72DRAFT_862195 [Pluteus cervinus]
MHAMKTLFSRKRWAGKEGSGKRDIRTKGNRMRKASDGRLTADQYAFIRARRDRLSKKSAPHNYKGAARIATDRSHTYGIVWSGTRDARNREDHTYSLQGLAIRISTALTGIARHTAAHRRETPKSKKKRHHSRVIVTFKEAVLESLEEAEGCNTEGQTHLSSRKRPLRKKGSDGQKPGLLMASILYASSHHTAASATGVTPWALADHAAESFTACPAIKKLEHEPEFAVIVLEQGRSTSIDVVKDAPLAQWLMTFQWGEG